MNDDRYPQRLKDCDDAPLILFYKGNANLNQQRVINIVGTRHCTPYGEDLIRRFITDLKQLSPNVLIMSGLAYGVDIVAHRQALASGYETIGVLAHGLDDLYPRQHRETAARMIEQGGLLTEFLTRTNADKINFVRRNRIVAGMSDACILIESAAHGGGLITCDISQSYGEKYCDRAFDFLEELKAENNHIVRMWKECGLPVENAGDSQALIQLKKEYCDKKECLRCRIGYEYLKR